MKHYRSVYATFRDREQAAEIARILVNEGLVACVNVIDKISSIYRWQGEVIEDTETVFFAKTIESSVEAVIARIVQLHSYDIPCVLALPIVGGHPPYLDWIDQSVRG